MDCLNKTKNLDNYTYSCSKTGMYYEYIEYHSSLRQLSASCFPDNIEIVYDGSIENFVKLFQQGRN